MDNLETVGGFDVNLSGFQRIFPLLRIGDQCRLRSFQEMARGSGDFTGKNGVSSIESRIAHENSGFSNHETVSAKVRTLPDKSCTVPAEGGTLSAESGTASAEVCMLFAEGCTLPAVTGMVPVKTGTVSGRQGTLSVGPEKTAAEVGASFPMTGTISAV